MLLTTSIPGLTLRPWRVTDAERLAALGNNPAIARNLLDSFPQPYTLDAAQKWIRTCLDQPQPPHLFVIAFNDEFVGGIGAHPNKDIHRFTAEIGYWIGEPHWGKGYGTAALKAFTAYIFAHHPFVRLEAGVFPYAAASGRILEKSGFHKETINRNMAHKDGVTYDRHLYVLLK